MYNLESYLNAPIFQGVIAGEIEKPQTYRCFPGAWYYKALSSKDKWLGIEGIVKLPEFFPDESRFEIVSDSFSKSKTFKKYLDTPSIYVGGSSDYETDIGLAWFRGLVNNQVSDEKITFRPFWRYIYPDNEGKIKNEYHGTSLNEIEYYFYPHDEVKINLFCPKENCLQLRIELIKETDILKYQQIRKSNGVKNKVLLTDLIPAPGNGIHLSEYKRVNAIDQYANEGKPAFKTNAIVTESIWKDVYLFREVNEKLVKVKFDESRYIRMLCPEVGAFTYKIENNQESIIINPNKNGRN